MGTQTTAQDSATIGQKRDRPFQRPATAIRMPMRNMPSIDSGQKRSSASQHRLVEVGDLDGVHERRADGQAERHRLGAEEEPGQPALAEGLGAPEHPEQAQDADLEGARPDAERHRLDAGELGLRCR